MSGSWTIALVGVGAMGCLLGSALSHRAAQSGAAAAAKIQVWLLGSWSSHLVTLRQRGVTVVHADGRQTQQALAVTADVGEIPAADVVLILVKSQQTPRAAQQAARLVKPDGVVISLQNGLGNLGVCAAVCGTQRVAAGVTFQGAHLVAPGVVRHAGEGPTYLGVSPALAGKLHEVAALLSTAGLETVLVDNVDSLLWGKLAVNAAINPLTALLEIPNGHLLARAEWRHLVAAAAREVARVAAAQGIALPFVDAAERALHVCRATADNQSSMWQDRQRGVPTEIEAITGAVVRCGRRLGLPTPVNAALYDLVRAQESGQRVDLERLRMPRA